MSDREHFIATLQACYFGDKNAFDEIVRIYDKKENIIKEVRYYIVAHKLYNFKYDEEELFEITTDEKAKDDLLNILQGSE